MRALNSLHSLDLILEGFAEARAVESVSAACLAGLTRLGLLLRGTWEPGWEGLEEAMRTARMHSQLPSSGGGEQGDASGTGARARVDVHTCVPRLSCLLLRDERPKSDEGAATEHATVDIAQASLSASIGVSRQAAHQTWPREHAEGASKVAMWRLHGRKNKTQ